MTAARTPKALGLLLGYPSAELVMACPEIRTLLAEEGWIPPEARAALEPLLTRLETDDLLDLQEDYTGLFDRTPSLALHLFEHVHGDSRDRGQALVELDVLYREVGLHNASEHTPDYLPLFLEYLSALPSDKAREDLAGAINVIGALRARLENRETAYAAVFRALEAMSAARPDPVLLEKALKADSGRPRTQEELDAAWEEQFAFADVQGQDQKQGGCSKADDMLRRMEAGS